MERPIQLIANALKETILEHNKYSHRKTYIDHKKVKVASIRNNNIPFRGPKKATILAAEEKSSSFYGIQTILDIITATPEQYSKPKKTETNLEAAAALIQRLQHDKKFNQSHEALNTISEKDPILRPIITHLIKILSTSRKNNPHSLKGKTLVLQILDEMNTTIKKLVEEKGLQKLLGPIEFYISDTHGPFAPVHPLLHTVLKTLKK